MGSVIDLVVHGPPGSAPPVLAQAFVDGLAQAGIDTRQVRLLDRGGDPGVDAMATLAARPGDGDILSTCTPVFLQAPLLRGLALTHRALTPLARLVTDHFFLVVGANSPFADAAGFAAALPRRQTRTGGYFLGGINHLLALSIADKARADIAFTVTADEPAVWDALTAGALDWACGVGAELLPLVEAGRVRVLAVLDDERRPPFAAAPPLAEHGLPVAFTLWRGLIGPPALSPVQQLDWHRVAAAVTRTRAWQEYLHRNGQSDSFLAGAAFGAFLEAEWRWYETHLGLAGLLAATS